MEIAGLETTPKEEDEGQMRREKKTTNGFRIHLGPKTMETELRLGFSTNGHDDNMGVVKQRNCGFGVTKRWFSETEDDYGSQWSLGPNQEKAVFQQNLKQQQQGVNPSLVPRAPSVVGWPPIRTSRKNLVPNLKPNMEPKDVFMSSPRATKKSEESLYVKVNMEGYAVGRKINLKNHDSYESLSQALREMFDNFLVNNSMNPKHFKGKGETPKYVLIYEDSEGDRMLVGDVPWEMFINAVKRLHIIDSKVPSTDVGTERRTQ